MAEALGQVCIVLHGHLPYVLHHGSHPHGEAWLLKVTLSSPSEIDGLLSAADYEKYVGAE